MRACVEGSFPVPSRSTLSFALLQSSSQTAVCALPCVSVFSNAEGNKQSSFSFT